MAYYYKVPAIYEYEEIGDQEVIREDVKEPERKLVGIRPDFPSGVSYTCRLVGKDVFIVKTERPVSIKGFDDAERLVHGEARTERKSLDRLAPEEAQAINRLRQSYSLEVKR